MVSIKLIGTYLPNYSASHPEDCNLDTPLPLEPQIWYVVRYSFAISQENEQLKSHNRGQLWTLSMGLTQLGVVLCSFRLIASFGSVSLFQVPEIKEQGPNWQKAVISTVRKKVGSVQGLLCPHWFPENTRQLTGNSAHARDKKLRWNLCLNVEKCFFGQSVNNAGRPAFHLDQTIARWPVSQCQWESLKETVKAFSFSASRVVSKDTWRSSVFLEQKALLQKQ
jgi:hypothetical protein